MENKLPIFASLPNSELSNLSVDKVEEKVTNKPRSIDSEFNETNQHTKQTQETGTNTDNTDNSENTAKKNDIINDTNANVKKNRLGKLMGGSFAVDLVDMLLPSLVILLMRYLGFAMEKKDIQLSKSEKETLSPAVQDCLDDINIDFNNPWVNLSIMLGIVYGSKMIDKGTSIKKIDKSKPKEEKKSMAEAVASAVNESGEQGEEVSDMAKFEIDYGKLVDEVRLSRKRGVGDAKQYLADNYPEKIKAIAKKHGITERSIQDKLNFTWIPKKRIKTDFDESQL
jgi:hypothetical protein